MSNHTKVKVVLAIWVIGYLVIACGPALSGDGLSGFILGGFFGLLLGSALFIPWVAGLVLLVGAYFLTRPGRI